MIYHYEHDFLLPETLHEATSFYILQSCIEINFAAASPGSAETAKQEISAEHVAISNCMRSATCLEGGMWSTMASGWVMAPENTLLGTEAPTGQHDDVTIGCCLPGGLHRDTVQGLNWQKMGDILLNLLL